MSKKIYILLGFGFFLLGIFIALLPNLDDYETTSLDKEQIEVTNFVPSEIQIQKLHFQGVPEPKFLEGFIEGGHRNQIKLIKRLKQQHTLTAEEAEFLKNELLNEKHHEVLRNEIASLLVNLDQPDPMLYLYFAKMAKDESLSDVWREYCIQFLGLTLPYAKDKAYVQQQLQAHAQEHTQEAAGTAILQIAYQQGRGRLEPALNETAKHLEMLKQSEVHPNVTLSVLAVMGKQKDTQALPALREYAQKDTSQKCLPSLFNGPDDSPSR